MKKLILIALVAVVMAGCEESNETIIPVEKTVVKIDGLTSDLYVIDSCEYIERGHGLTHKGNCRFCAER